MISVQKKKPKTDTSDSRIRFIKATRSEMELVKKEKDDHFEKNWYHFMRHVDLYMLDFSGRGLQL
ncbi:hypothetical protein B7C51_05845 [Paenibacillus larvae subsp. pulvifaciens]|uniref:Uncharacterized protein n=1 Tax=Paenibacillus larvae subsp. pulvifaciens TaxID=1477 RepID=A0A1V0UR48_9BACL|nr:hypothetical protein B7C51_05845 [Paenibacillus larvae subsp. pulvifaciens]